LNAATAAPAKTTAPRLAPVSSATDAPPREVKYLTEANKCLYEQEQQMWRMVAPRGALPSDFHMDHRPFGYVAQNMRRFDKVHIQAMEGHWYAEYIVVDVLAPGYALCHMTHAFDVPPRRNGLSEIPEGYEIRQGVGDEPDWVVIRTADGLMLNRGLLHIRTRHDALSYLLDHASVRGVPLAPGGA
jgi:hypothetical protein